MLRRRELLIAAAVPTLVKGYGWNQVWGINRDERTPDEVSFTPSTTQRPDSVDLSARLPAAPMQLLNDCTAQVWAEMLWFLNPGFQASRLFIYWNERALTQTTAHDWGSSIKDGGQTLLVQGACPESMWPYVPSKYRQKPPMRCYHDVVRIKQALRLNTLDDMLGCLAEGFPFVFGLLVYPNFGSGPTGFVPMPIAGQQPVRGHALTAAGYDMKKRAFLCLNSAGPYVGLNGYFWIPFDYLTVTNPNYAFDFWTAR